MLYLVRHADAIDLANDDERTLSPRGREQTRRLAAFLRAGELEAPAEIWHSPLVRARQTAEIFAGGLQWTAPLRAMDGLLPNDPPGPLAKRLAKFNRSVAVFGHNPHISLLATLLVTGRVAPAVFGFRKCAALALESGGDDPPGGWVVHWHVDPHLFG
jgi:phosphohistidine phosphatase